MDTYECIDCGGKVVYQKPPERKIDRCSECGQDKDPHYLHPSRLSSTFVCEKCKRTYSSGMGFFDTEDRPHVDLKDYNFSKEK